MKLKNKLTVQEILALGASLLLSETEFPNENCFLRKVLLYGQFREHSKCNGIYPFMDKSSINLTNC